MPNETYSPRAFLGVPTSGVGWVSPFEGKPRCYDDNNHIIQPNEAAAACAVERYGHGWGCPPPGQDATAWKSTHYCAEQMTYNADILHYACLAGEYGTPQGDCEPTMQQIADMEMLPVKGSGSGCPYITLGFDSGTQDKPIEVAYPVGEKRLGGGRWAAGLQQQRDPATRCPLWYNNTPPSVPVPEPVPEPVPAPVPEPVPPPAPAPTPTPEPVPVPPVEYATKAELDALVEKLREEDSADFSMLNAALGRTEDQLDSVIVQQTEDRNALAALTARVAKLEEQPKPLPAPEPPQPPPSPTPAPTPGSAVFGSAKEFVPDFGAWMDRQEWPVPTGSYRRARVTVEFKPPATLKPGKYLVAWVVRNGRNQDMLASIMFDGKNAIVRTGWGVQNPGKTRDTVALRRGLDGWYRVNYVLDLGAKQAWFNGEAVSPSNVALVFFSGKDELTVDRGYRPGVNSEELASEGWTYRNLEVELQK